MSEQKHLPTLSLFSLLFCAIQKLIFTFFSFYGFCESVVVTFQQTVCVHPDCPAVCQIYNNDTRSLPCVKCYGSNTSFATVNSWQTRQMVSVHVAVPLANNGVSRMINVSVILATPFKKKNNKKNKLFSAWNDVQCNDVDVWTLWARQCRSERCAAPRGFALVVHLCVSVRDEVPGFIMCICSSTVSVRNKLCIWNFAATCVCLFVYLIDWAAE